jgi:hypothetical protein
MLYYAWTVNSGASSNIKSLVNFFQDAYLG